MVVNWLLPSLGWKPPVVNLQLKFYYTLNSYIKVGVIAKLLFLTHGRKIPIWGEMVAEKPNANFYKEVYTINFYGRDEKHKMENSRLEGD